MSTWTKDGGAAFPCEQGHTPEGTWNQTFEAGMSLRDYFAAKALHAGHGFNPHHGDYERRAEHAYKLADAMLAARKGEQS